MSRSSLKSTRGRAGTTSFPFRQKTVVVLRKFAREDREKRISGKSIANAELEFTSLLKRLSGYVDIHNLNDRTKDKFISFFDCFKEFYKIPWVRIPPYPFLFG
jgi:hypothetical protein